MIPFRPQIVAALLGAVLVIGLLLAGAAGPSSQGAASESSGTYVEAMIGAPRAINPLLATTGTDADLTRLIFSGLTQVDDRGEIVLDLAESYEISPDGLVYTFTLKPDLTWHDGEPVTADDVFVTFGFVQDPAFPGDPALSTAWLGVKVEPVTPRVVRFTLSAPNASFLQQTTLGVLPRHLWSEVAAADLPSVRWNLAPVGAGRWRYVPPRPTTNDAEVTPVPGSIPESDGVLLEPNLSRMAEPPHIARIWFRLYPTFGAALAGFQRGEVHGLGHIPPERVEELEGLPGVTVHRQNLARYTLLMLNTRSPLFRDTETRRALALAIDREAIIERALQGEGVAEEGPVLPHSWALDRSIKPLGYNPVEARRLLDNAGWRASAGGVRVREGVTMTTVLAVNQDIPVNVAVARELEQGLRQVGVDVQLALVSRDTLLRDYLTPRAFHMVLAGWEARGPDPDLFAFWHSSQRDIEGGLSFSGWANPEADQALSAARSAQDRTARGKEYTVFQQAFAYHVPAAVLYSPLYAYATRAPAAGVRLPDTDLLTPAERFTTLREWSLGAR